MNATPVAIDDYLLDLLAGDAAPAARESAHAPEAPAHAPALEQPPAVMATAPILVANAIEATRSTEDGPTIDVSLLTAARGEPMAGAMDEEFGVCDSAAVRAAVAAVFPGPPSAQSPVDATASLLAEFDEEFPDQAPAAPDAAPGSGAMLDRSADLLAEFDAEFPDQAVIGVPAIDTTADLLAEFDSEFPDQAPPAHSASPVDCTDDLLAEFDAEFPEQARAPEAADTSAALLAEFDAEFPDQAAGTASADAFAAAVAEETAADHVAPLARTAAKAPPAPAFAPVLPATPSMPAYAKPVYDLLQKQAQDQLDHAQSPHGDRRRAADRTSRWLRMRCDDQHYALELLKVQEVVLPATLLPLRGAARHMLGVMNLRGQVVPVIDLGLYLGREAIVGDMQTRIVVLEEQGEILGLRVSAVEDVTTLTEQQIEPPDNTRMCRITHPLFRGVARLSARTVILLDASELLK